MTNKIARLPAVKEQLGGICTSRVYQMMERDGFPKPIKLGARAVGWLQSDIDNWLNQRVEERDRRQRGAR